MLPLVARIVTSRWGCIDGVIVCSSIRWLCGPALLEGSSPPLLLCPAISQHSVPAPLPLLGCTENFNIPFHSLNAASRYLRLVDVF